MLKNYLKISLRNLYKYKGFSVINILGLAMSMSICLLIIMVLKDQSSFDRFHVHKDRIYRVNSLKLTKDRDTELHGPSPSALASILRAEYPGVEKKRCAWRRCVRWQAMKVATFPSGASTPNPLSSTREGGTNLHAFSLQALTDINLGPIMNSPLG